MANKELPHDLLAEKSLIGCLLVDGESFDDISNLKIEGKDFFDKRLGIIYEVLLELYHDNKPIDYVTVTSTLTGNGKIHDIGGQSFLLDIIDNQVSAANVYHYAKIVKDKASLREIIRTAERVAVLGANYTGKIEDFFQDVEASFFGLTNQAKSNQMLSLKSCLKSNLKELETSARDIGEVQGLTTGYPKVDELLLGMQPGQLIILAARPAMGKTSLALNIAHNACAATGMPIAIFSLEMLAPELSMRLLSSKAKVDSKRIKTKNFLDMDLRNLSKAISELSTYPIYINDDGNSTVVDILSQCRKIKADRGLGLIVIDYLQLMQSHTKNPSREQQISEISRCLKSMAKELACPVLALSQLNRQVESRPNKRPNTADLRESGAIEQDADIVMFVYRDEVYNPDTKEPGVAEIIVGKNRSGEIGTAKLAWVGAHTSFEKLSFAGNDQKMPPPRDSGIRS